MQWSAIFEASVTVTQHQLSSTLPRNQHVMNEWMKVLFFAPHLCVSKRPLCHNELIQRSCLHSFTLLSLKSANLNRILTSELNFISLLFESWRAVEGMKVWRRSQRSSSLALNVLYFYLFIYLFWLAYAERRGGRNSGDNWPNFNALLQLNI